MTPSPYISLARQNSIKALLITIGFLCLGTNCLRAETPPNIIFILTDDQRDNSFSAMGHEWIQTPNIDKLISQSTRFENAYIAEPTCMPSRASLLLGLHERINHWVSTRSTA